MEITKELLQAIYDRAVQVSLAKFNGTPDQVHLDNDGNIDLVWDISCCGETEYESQTITTDELNSDLDQLILERKEKEEIARQERLKKDKEIRIQKEAFQKKQRHAQYLQLKKEFEL